MTNVIIAYEATNTYLSVVQRMLPLLAVAANHQRPR